MSQTRLQWNDSRLPATRSQQRSGTPVSACFQCHKCSHRLPDRPGDGFPAQPGHAAGSPGGGSRGARVAGDLALRLVRGLHHALPDGDRHRRRDGRPADHGHRAPGGPARRPRQAVQPQLPGQRSAARPGVRDGHDGRLQAPHRRPVLRRRTRSRRCWPRASSRCCPSAAAASSEVREVFRRAEEEEKQP